MKYLVINLILFQLLACSSSQSDNSTESETVEQVSKKSLNDENAIGQQETQKNTLNLMETKSAEKPPSPLLLASINQHLFHPLAIHFDKKNTYFSLYSKSDWQVQIKKIEDSATINQDQLFILTPSLGYKSRLDCVSILSADHPNYYLEYVEGNTPQIKLTPFNVDENFLKNSTFCLKQKEKSPYNQFSIAPYKELGKYLNYETSFVDSFAFMDQVTSNIVFEKTFLLDDFIFKSEDNGFIKYVKLGNIYKKNIASINAEWFYQNFQLESIKVDFSTLKNLDQKSVISKFRIFKEQFLSNKSTDSSMLSDLDGILVPPLAQTEDKACFSFFNFKNSKYLRIQNYQFIFSAPEVTDDFRSQATFCLENLVGNLFRIKSFEHQDYYLNFHSINDEFVYLKKDNSMDSTISAIRLKKIEKSSSNDYAIQEIYQDKIYSLVYKYNHKNKLFMRASNPNVEVSTQDFEIILDESMDCYFYDSITKSFHRPKSQKESVWSFNFSEVDQNSIQEFHCAETIRNTYYEIKCSNPQFPLYIKSDCELNEFKKDQSKVYEKGDWSHIRFSKSKIDN